jgi:branched-chain amino acid transport system permease protein
VSYVEVSLIGIIVGSYFALSATGIVVTYQATGVFNIAHFAIALLAGYLGWQLSGVWGLPLVAVVPLVLLICGPGLGLLLERVVFRPLQHRKASSSEKLVAALGVTVALLAVINAVWGPGVQGTNVEPVPRLFALHPFDIGSLTFDTEQVGFLATTLIVAGLLYLLFQRTFLGVSIRAVVDRRELAELAAIDSNRVSQVAWTVGCTLAAITGLIITQGTLEPVKIIFFGIETFSIAVVARLTSVPKAILYGMALGLVQALVKSFHPFGADNNWAETYSAIAINLSSLLLFGALVLFRRLDEVGASETAGSGLVQGELGGRRLSPAGAAVGIVMSVGALVSPYFLSSSDLRLAQIVMALIIIFTSIVCITGFSGHLTLGQASIAGLGAFFTARAANGLHVPVLIAMLAGGLVAVGAGLLAGYPALRRKGLFLGLTTLGLALIIDRFVFNARMFKGGPGGLTMDRPVLFGLDFTSDRAFYYFEGIVVILFLLLARNLRSGRLGRVLAAMRDSETAAQSIGINLRRAKLFVFAVSSFMAGIGGALMAQSGQNWDNNAFNPVLGLFWFTVVVVCGISSLGGGVLAAVLYVFIPRQLDLDIASAIGFFGFAAVFLGRLPGGLIAQPVRLAQWFRGRVGEHLALQRQPAPTPPPAPEPSPFAEKVLAEQAGGAR